MLTIIMPYYDNPGMLALQFGLWKAWPSKHRKRLRVIIVDDGSPESPAANVPRPYGLPEIAIYRVAEDRPWNQHAARNIGAHEAGEGWMLLTDMDHVLSADAAAVLFRLVDAGRMDGAAAYMLDRVEADSGNPTLGTGGQPKPHPNSFVMTRETYWRIGGYDEDYCGIYGTDRLFRSRAAERAGLHALPVPLTRYWRDIIPDASTRTLLRKEGRDPGAKARVRAEKASRGEADRIKVLSCAWERVL